MIEWKEWLEPQYLWALLGLVLFALEFVLPGLVIAFFGGGACLVALTCVFFDPSLNEQLLLFIGVSVALLVLLRRWLRATFFGHSQPSPDLSHAEEEYVGHPAVVLDAIRPGHAGAVEFRGTRWPAVAERELDPGTEVVIRGQEGLTLHVSKP